MESLNSKLLSNAATSREDKVKEDRVSYKKTLFEDAKKYLKKVLKKLLPPVPPAIKGFLKYYEPHFKILKLVLSSIKKREKVESQIREYSKNVQDIQKYVKTLIYEANNVPEKDFDSFVKLLIIANKDNEDFKKMYNEALSSYLELLGEFLNDLNENSELLKKLIDNSSPIIEAIRTEIEVNFKPKNSIDLILNESFKKNLTLIQLSIETDIRELVNPLENVINHLRVVYDRNSKLSLI